LTRPRWRRVQWVAALAVIAMLVAPSILAAEDAGKDSVAKKAVGEIPGVEPDVYDAPAKERPSVMDKPVKSAGKLKDRLFEGWKFPWTPKKPLLDPPNYGLDFAGPDKIDPGHENVPVSRINVTNPGGPDVLWAINVTTNYTQLSDVDSVALWRDTDDDGNYSQTDTLIATNSTVGAKMNFTGLGLALGNLETEYFFIVVNVSSFAPDGDTLSHSIDAGDIWLGNAGSNTGPADHDDGWTTIDSSLIVIPHLIYGYVYDISGSPLNDSLVTVTNNRTGEWLTNVTDATGRYKVDLSEAPSQYNLTDGIVVQANATAPFGRNWTVVTDSFGDWCNVSMELGPVTSAPYPNNTLVFGQYHPLNVTVLDGDGLNGVDPASMLLWVNGTNFTVDGFVLIYDQATGNLSFNASDAGMSWFNGQDVNVTLWYANDTAGNPCQNVPYSWNFSVLFQFVTKAPDIRVHKEGNDVNITWFAVENATRYNIYRSTLVNGSGFNWSNPLALNVKELYYVDAGALTDGNNYSYVVVGKNPAGEGPRSNIGWKYRRFLQNNPSPLTSNNWLALPYNSELTDAKALSA